jgi:colanic acid biosynthesis glycosyl transferase WcaI
MSRVLFVNQYFPPDASATAYLLGELTADLAADFEVAVVAGRPSYNPDRGMEPPAGVALTRAWSTSFNRTSMPGRLVNYATFLAGATVAALRAPRPDVVVAFTDPPFAPLIGKLVASLRRSHFVYVCWDVYPDIAVALGRLDNPLFVALWRRLNRFLLRSADRVVAVGRDMCEKLENEGVAPARLKLIRHWASVECPSPADVRDARMRMGWDGKFVVMHAGNTGLAQNLDVLVRAAALLRERDDLAFVVMGEGAARPALEDHVRRLGLAHFQFLPQASRSDAQPLLAAADLHLVSHAPGLRGTAVASKVYGVLALGRPFVAAVEEESEIDRLLRETGAGERVPPGDHRRLADEIVRFATGERDRSEAGIRGRRAFEEHYRREHGVGHYRAMLAELTRESPGMTRPAYARGWDELAAEDPYWAILFERSGEFDPSDDQAFLATGQAQVEALLARGARHRRPEGHETALDFGCGAGRLSRALASHFGRVRGVDISPRMVSLARQLNADLPTCEFEVVEQGDRPPPASFDLVCSLLVLQHVPVASERRALLRALVAALRERGLLIVQLTTHVPLRHRLQPRARLYTALRALRVPSAVLYRRLGLHPIRMAAIGESDAERLIEDAGGRVLDRIKSSVSGVVSITYFVTTPGEQT